MQVRILIDYLKSDKGQDKALRQVIQQHELFASPTVLAVAQILVGRDKAAGGSSKKPQKSIESVAAELEVDNEKYYPASYAQEQTFVLNASGAGAAYNMPWIVDVKGKFDKEAMIRAHDLVVKREQPLRTVLRLNPSLSKTGDTSVQQSVLPMHDSRSCWDLCEHNAQTYEEAIRIPGLQLRHLADSCIPPAHCANQQREACSNVQLSPCPSRYWVSRDLSLSCCDECSSSSIRS